MKKKIDGLAKDLWIVLLDIIAVNLSYFLAILIRFYVNFQLRPVAVNDYLPVWIQFTPFYTLGAIGVFMLFKLYGGMWRFAGINDMNRIIGASLITALLHVLGTIAFFPKRMPVTYYIIGAILQFTFIVIIRFAYRVLLAEKKKISSRRIPAINVMVVGVGDIGQQIISQVKGNQAFHLVCIMDNNSSMDGKMMDGIPVIGGIEKIQEVITKFSIQSVFVADQQLSSEEREAITEACEKQKVEIQDYTGYLSNADDAAPLSAVLGIVKGPIKVNLNEESFEYENNYQALKDLTGRYTIQSISTTSSPIIIDLRSNQQTVFVLSDDKEEAYVGYDAWAQRRRERQ